MTERKMPPTKESIAELEPFQGLEMDRISVVTNEHEAELAFEELMAAGLVGFDTESKPTFQKGQQSGGPHVLQFATLERAFIFQPQIAGTEATAVNLLKSRELTKVGFGLKGDFTQILNRFGIRPTSIIDLDRSFKVMGYKNAVGAKSAIAMLFNRKLLKSKSVTTSNWALLKLSERQLVYAANDAYAALRVYHALQEIEAAGEI
jgi:ribonuclease D